MKSTNYSRMCRRIFQNFFERFNIIETGRNKLLEKANISMVYQEYYSMCLMNLIIGFIASFIPTLFLYILVPNDITALLILIVSSSV